MYNWSRLYYNVYNLDGIFKNWQYAMEVLMAVYEHLRKYKVVYADKTEVALGAPQGRQYWERFMAQSTAKSLFKRKLKKGDTVVFRRVSNAVTTYYVPSKLI